MPQVVPDVGGHRTEGESEGEGAIGRCHHTNRSGGSVRACRRIGRIGKKKQKNASFSAACALPLPT